MGKRTTQLVQALEDLRQTNEELEREVGERARAEQAAQRQAAFVNAINGLLQQTLGCESAEEVAQAALDVAMGLTDSLMGFVGEVNDAGRFDTLALSDVAWSVCRVPRAEALRMLKNMEIRGLWGKVVLEERSLILNDPANHPDRVGTPEGHPAITSFLGVPLKRGERTIGMWALANKPGGYAQADQEALETVAAALVEALYRVRQQVVVRESEDLLRATLESTADGILVVDEGGKVVHANTQFAEMWQIPEELLAAGDDSKLLAHVLENLHQPEAFLEKVQQLYRSTQEDLDTIPLRDGRVLERYSRPLIRDGEIGGRVWSFRDITQRHHADKQLRLNEARLQALVRLGGMTDASLKEITDFAMEEGVSLTGSTIGYLAFMNEDETVLTMHSWSATAMKECAIEDKPVVYPLETTGLWGEAVRQRRPVITNDYAAPDPRKKGYPPGHVAVLRHMNVPVFDGDRIVAVAGVGNKEEPYDESDVMQLRLLMDAMWRLIQRQRAAAALQQAHDELERRVDERTAELARSNAALEQFAYVASHDLQEPLRKVVAFGDRLRAKCGAALGDQGQDYVDRMQGAARRMQMLINDLLTYSRVTTKAQPFAPVDLAEVARDVVSDLEVRIQETEGRVEIHGLPTIQADALQMHQLLQNLIGNALKFRRKDEAPTVNVVGRILGPRTPAGAGEPEGPALCQIVVEDNGIGFEERYLDRIFGVFQRLHRRTEYEGTGMGLAICRRIAERHNGTITAQSTPGTGSRFTVTLPIRQTAEEGTA